MKPGSFTLLSWRKSLLLVYVNYPNPKFSVHRNPSCGEVQKMEKAEQRLVRIDTATVSVELQRFQDKAYIFAAKKEANDMWLEIDFVDSNFEEAVLRYIQQLVGNHYPPLGIVDIHNHCQRGGAV